MIGQFAKTLTNSNLEFDAIDLADMLWLAQFIESGNATQLEAEQTGKKGDKGSTTSSSIDKRGSSSLESALNLYTDNQNQAHQGQREKKTEQTTENFKGQPFSVPAAPALRTRLDLARALRPLMRKVSSRTRFDLDEDATVTQIAETEVWMPLVRARPERWLELDVVVEDSKTTVIWERVIAELNLLAEYQGAFRAVRTWRLTAESGQVQLFPRWSERTTASTHPISRRTSRPRSPKELIDPTGRRLIWVVTDCTSLLWREGIIHRTLSDWSKVQPIAIIQMFPEKLWSRTALRDGHIVKLRSLAPGLPSARLETEGLPRHLERRGGVDLVTVPIVTLDASAMRSWAGVVSGFGNIFTPGRTFDLAFLRKQTTNKGRSSRSPQTISERTAQERVALFRSTASKTACQLANLMAATPVSLPVIDLLRDAFRGEFQEEVQQSHVAEVLLSGILRRCDTEEDAMCRYEFWGDSSPNDEERVRDVLLGDASISKTMAVLNVLTDSIYRKLGSPSKSFLALLGELEASEGELRDIALPFAKIGISVLHRLGGEYAAIARRHGYSQSGDGEENEYEQDDFPLQDLEYEVAKLIDFPPLEILNFTTAQLVEASDREETDRNWPPPLQTEEYTVAMIAIPPPAVTDSIIKLETFEFKVVQLVKRETKVGLFEHFPASWSKLDLFGQSRRYVEQIDENTALEMVEIPGGRFMMGAPENETESSDSEKPQHLVTVPGFYMGRYPITQAQWSAVSALPQIERPLDPDPSSFKGNTRPVEQVSWKDAIEFCVRLSKHAKRHYRLPSEAEWEYACRAGTTTPFHFGETISPELANYSGDISYDDGPTGDNQVETTPVDYFDVGNAWGLSDMHGNVFEWCQDHWHQNYMRAPEDGSAWLTDKPEASRVFRGGSWSWAPGYCRSASRLLLVPRYRHWYLGFRVCCSAPQSLCSTIDPV